MTTRDEAPGSPWPFIALATLAVGVIVVAGPVAGGDAATAVAAVLLVAFVLYVMTRRDDVEVDAEQRWILVRNCANIQDAFFIRAALEGSEIESLIPDEHVANMRSDLVTAIGGVRVLVRAADFDRARGLLDAADQKGPR
jgi:Putative prokaryotic signal transducing protein